MQRLVGEIRDDVEDKRNEILAPLAAEEAEVLGGIDRGFQKLHHANSIVTGHLASIVKVHEVQADLLDAIGIEKDFASRGGWKYRRHF